MDLFATKQNAKCVMYVSPVPDPQALDVDALSMDWEGLNAYAYPPTQIIVQVLQKFMTTKQCRLILVAPFWPNQSWFPNLRRLAGSQVLEIPPTPSMLKQPNSNIFHFEPERLALHAWRLLRDP